MPHRDAALIGAPCWVDLSTSDPDKARAFYGELFDWKAEEPNAEFGGYFNFVKDGVLVAGGMANAADSGMPDLWSVYLATDNAQATTDAAAANGGQVIVPPMAVGDLGTMAVVTDAGQAAIGMWQPGTHKGFGVHGEPGTPTWFELHTRDYDAAVAFYRTVFKWNANAVSDTPELHYTTLNEGDEQLAGIMDASAFLRAGAPAQWFVYFGTADADATLARITDLGGSVVQPAEDTPYGRLAVAADPTGAVFRVVQSPS